MPVYRATILYKVKNVRHRVTRKATVADFTKLTRPMKQEIRDRFPKADIYETRILRQLDRPARTKKRR